MLLADCICTSSVQSFNLVSIGCLQWAKYSNITRLELVRGIRRDTTQENIVFKTILQDFERLMRPETVANQNTWLLMRMYSGLGIKHTFEPLQADLRVGVSRFGARIMPSRRGVYSPVASIG